MPDEIAGWLAKNALDGIDGLLDRLLEKADDLDELKLMEEEDVAEVLSTLGLKDMKVRKVKKAFATLNPGQLPSPRSPAVHSLTLPAGEHERLEVLQEQAEAWHPRRWVLRREVGRGGSGFVAGRKRPGGLRLRASAACVWSILLGAFPTSWAPWLRAALHPKSLRT